MTRGGCRCDSAQLKSKRRRRRTHPLAPLPLTSMANHVVSDEEEAILRLIYDYYCSLHRDQLNVKHFNIIEPYDGIAKRIVGEGCNPKWSPFAISVVDARTVWRYCCKEREVMSSAALIGQRESDLALVDACIESTSGMTDLQKDEMRQSLGMHIVCLYPDGAPGGYHPDAAKKRQDVKVSNGTARSAFRDAEFPQSPSTSPKKSNHSSPKKPVSRLSSISLIY